MSKNHKPPRNICVYCDLGKALVYSESMDAMASIRENSLVVNYKSETDKDPMKKPINYCPICGRQLRDRRVMK